MRYLKVIICLLMLCNVVLAEGFSTATNKTDIEDIVDPNQKKVTSKQWMNVLAFYQNMYNVARSSLKMVEEVKGWAYAGHKMLSSIENLSNKCENLWENVKDLKNKKWWNPVVVIEWAEEDVMQNSDKVLEGAAWASNSTEGFIKSNISFGRACKDFGTTIGYLFTNPTEFNTKKKEFQENSKNMYGDIYLTMKSSAVEKSTAEYLKSRKDMKAHLYNIELASRAVGESQVKRFQILEQKARAEYALSEAQGDGETSLASSSRIDAINAENYNSISLMNQSLQADRNSVASGYLLRELMKIEKEMIMRAQILEHNNSFVNDCDKVIANVKTY